SQLVAVGDNGHLYKITSGATTDLGTMGTGYLPVCKPAYHNGGTKQYLIIPHNTGSARPYKWNGSTLTLSTTVPAAAVCAVYKSRLVMANSSTNRNRLWFSPVTTTSGADIDQTWNTSSWLDVDYPVVGLAPLQNSLLVFSTHQTERLTGTTPPPGTDFDHAPVGKIGCVDARSITIWQNYAIFANTHSIYLTNGVGFRDLLAEAGLTSYWQGILAGYTGGGGGGSPIVGPSTWTIASGLLWNRFLLVTVLNGSTHVDTLCCDLPRNAWWRFSNMRAVMYATATDVRDELYYADRSTGRVVALSGCWSPASSNKTDADGTAVAPLLETRVIAPSAGIKTYGIGRVSYDLRGAAADNPTLAVSFARGLEATTFQAAAESPLSETTDETRRKFTIGGQSQGVTVRLAQTGPSAKTELYSLEAEVLPIGEEYGGQ